MNWILGNELLDQYKVEQAFFYIIFTRVSTLKQQGDSKADTVILIILDKLGSSLWCSISNSNPY